ncbi:Pyridoxal-5'-phosphate-dependent enzyme family protein [Rhynchospora pubera]|uniref:Pyridoxal-5'-phosphate-dependent enzyme family protein n=1 Tax=Rhynchospora pubera TaxID=906938 RepID=A0AAV8DI95_9POAL|nr:Pyridoxal-5'-phosphate-dependent enzyme family protein [Rhynchospora pubera]
MCWEPLNCISRFLKPVTSKQNKFELCGSRIEFVIILAGPLLGRHWALVGKPCRSIYGLYYKNLSKHKHVSPPRQTGGASHLRLRRRFPPPRHFSSVSDLLSKTSWHLPSPSTPIHTISVAHGRGHFSYSNLLDGEGRTSPTARFHVARDDLLHPLANGNKARKLDALLPLLRAYSATDVVTCGGCQSAHAAALAVYCAEVHIRPNLLLRGEQPQVPTGYNLISLMFGNVTYASRSVYAHRSQMLYDHAKEVAGPDGLVVWADDLADSGWQEPESSDPSRRVVIVNEGAASAVALLGVIRLIKFLSESSSFGNGHQVHVVVDAGTGTTAVGIALGALLLGCVSNNDFHGR